METTIVISLQRDLIGTIAVLFTISSGVVLALAALLAFALHERAI